MCSIHWETHCVQILRLCRQITRVKWSVSHVIMLWAATSQIGRSCDLLKLHSVVISSEAQVWVATPTENNSHVYMFDFLASSTTHTGLSIPSFSVTLLREPQNLQLLGLLWQSKNGNVKLWTQAYSYLHNRRPYLKFHFAPLFVHKHLF